MTQHFQVDITFLLALKKKHMDFSHVTLGYKNPISGVGHIPYLQTPFIKKSSEVSAGEHEEALEVLGEAGLQQPLLGMILQGITPRKISHVLSEKYISPWKISPWKSGKKGKPCIFRRSMLLLSVVL